MPLITVSRKTHDAMLFWLALTKDDFKKLFKIVA